MLQRDNISEQLAEVTPRYNFMLNLIRKAEGGYLHRNKSEVDITTGYGIYKGAHPKARVFDYINSVAKNLNEDRPSHVWDNNTIKLVNSKINPDVERWETYLFYKHYFRTWDFNVFPEDIIPVIVSIYCNAPKMFSTAYQRAVNQFIGMAKLNIPSLVVDGDVGPKTINTSKAIFALGPAAIKDFKNVLLNSCIAGYQNIVARNPKMNMYLRGWISRVESLRG